MVYLTCSDSKQMSCIHILGSHGGIAGGGHQTNHKVNNEEIFWMKEVKAVRAFLVLWYQWYCNWNHGVQIFWQQCCNTVVETRKHLKKKIFEIIGTIYCLELTNHTDTFVSLVYVWSSLLSYTFPIIHEWQCISLHSFWIMKEIKLIIKRLDLNIVFDSILFLQFTSNNDDSTQHI